MISINQDIKAFGGEALAADSMWSELGFGLFNLILNFPTTRFGFVGV